MKKLLLQIVIALSAPVFLLSCSDGDECFTKKNYIITEFWSDANFRPLNDEFNDIRNRQKSLFDGSYIAENPWIMTTDHNYGYEWVEVIYPKGEPENMQYSVYKTACEKTRSSSKAKGKISDNSTSFVRSLYKDGEIIGDIEYLPNGKRLFHKGNKKYLLYDFCRIAMAANEIYHLSAYSGYEENKFYSFSEAKGKFGRYLTGHVGIDDAVAQITSDPYGGKVIAYFGSLTSYLLPVNGPCAEDMVQEVIAIRYIDYGVGDTPADINKYDEVCFMYKNTESPAVPYLPESIWDIDDNSLWVINN